MGKASIRRRGKILGEGENDGDFFKLLTTHGISRIDIYTNGYCY